MNKGKYVYAQSVEFLPQWMFDNIVKKYDGNRNVKHFTCWNQLLVMTFGQLTNQDSLRDLIDVARQKRGNNDFEIKGKVYAFDSTTIDLCLSVF